MTDDNDPSVDETAVLLSPMARLRLYELAGYSQGKPANPGMADAELRLAGLMEGDKENARAHAVAETLLFHT